MFQANAFLRAPQVLPKQGQVWSITMVNWEGTNKNTWGGGVNVRIDLQSKIPICLSEILCATLLFLIDFFWWKVDGGWGGVWRQPEAGSGRRQKWSSGEGPQGGNRTIMTSVAHDPILQLWSFRGWRRDLFLNTEIWYFSSGFSLVANRLWL